MTADAVPRPPGRARGRRGPARLSRHAAGCASSRWCRRSALLILIGFIESPDFLTGDNFLAMLQQSTELSVLVLAEALILISGRMDLSLESTVTLAPVIALWLVLPTSGNRFNGLGLGAGVAGDPGLPAGRRRRSGRSTGS